jgi:hypothetical protein
MLGTSNSTATFSSSFLDRGVSYRAGLLEGLAVRIPVYPVTVEEVMNRKE